MTTLALPARHDRAAAGPRPGRTWRRAGVIVAVLLLAALLGLDGVLTIGARQDNARAAAAPAALTAARTAAVAVNTYSYNDLAAQERATRARLTDRFRVTYEHTMRRTVNAAAAKRHLSVAAEATHAAVVSADARRAVVLVALDQIQIAGMRTATHVTHYRLRLTMVRQDGRWLADGMQAL